MWGEGLVIYDIQLFTFNKINKQTKNPLCFFHLSFAFRTTGNLFVLGVNRVTVNLGNWTDTAAVSELYTNLTQMNQKGTGLLCHTITLCNVSD